MIKINKLILLVIVITFWGPENGSVTENLNRPWRIPSMITPPGLLKEMQDKHRTIAFYT